MSSIQFRVREKSTERSSKRQAKRQGGEAPWCSLGRSLRLPSSPFCSLFSCMRLAARREQRRALSDRMRGRRRPKRNDSLASLTSTSPILEDVELSTDKGEEREEERGVVGVSGSDCACLLREKKEERGQASETCRRESRCRRLENDRTRVASSSCPGGTLSRAEEETDTAAMAEEKDRASSAARFQRAFDHCRAPRLLSRPRKNKEQDGIEEWDFEERRRLSSSGDSRDERREGRGGGLVLTPSARHRLSANREFSAKEEEAPQTDGNSARKDDDAGMLSESRGEGVFERREAEAGGACAGQEEDAGGRLDCRLLSDGPFDGGKGDLDWEGEGPRMNLKEEEEVEGKNAEEENKEKQDAMSTGGLGGRPAIPRRTRGALSGSVLMLWVLRDERTRTTHLFVKVR